MRSTCPAWIKLSAAAVKGAGHQGHAEPDGYVRAPTSLSALTDYYNLAPSCSIAVPILCRLIFIRMHLLILAISTATPSSHAWGTVLKLAESRTAGTAYGQTLVIPDCGGSNLKISPCQRVARSWLNHLNARASAFAKAFSAAGHDRVVTHAVLDCSAGILADRKTRRGMRRSRHAYGEACDGSFITVNNIRFEYRRAVLDKNSSDRRFFVAFLDAWADIGPGCVPEKGYQVLGVAVHCRPIVADNCGVIDWRERGIRSQYGRTYHLSYCYYTDPKRAYE
ncbi:MAG: hypothetical protein ACR2PG_11390 [Hyphomicrobiaceae bacterium]